MGDFTYRDSSYRRGYHIVDGWRVRLTEKLPHQRPPNAYGADSQKFIPFERATLK